MAHIVLHRKIWRRWDLNSGNLHPESASYLIKYECDPRRPVLQRWPEQDKAKCSDTHKLTRKTWALLCAVTPHTFTTLSQHLPSTCTLQAFMKTLLLAGCHRSIAWLIGWQFIFKDSPGALFSGSEGLCQGPGAELSPAGEMLCSRCAILDQALIKSRLLTSGAVLWGPPPTILKVKSLCGSDEWQDFWEHLRSGVLRSWAGSAITGWDPDVKGGSGLLSVFVTPRCILLPSARD